MFAISNIHIVHVSVNIPQMQMFCCKSFLERFEDVHIYFIVARLKIELLTVRKKVLLAEQTSLLFLLKPFYFPVNPIM